MAHYGFRTWKQDVEGALLYGKSPFSAVIQKETNVALSLLHDDFNPAILRATRGRVITGNRITLPVTGRR